MGGELSMLLQMSDICILISLVCFVKQWVHTSGVVYHGLLFVLYLHHLNANGSALNGVQIILSGQNSSGCSVLSG